MSAAAPQYSRVETDDDDLGLNLVGPARGSTLVSTTTPLMSVIAPATLPEGYVFEATIGAGRYKVTVPPGGVEEGQKFEVPLPTQINSTLSIPVGHWRDSLCSCFQHGPCHPHWWTGLCCGLLAAGQVIRRLKLTWYGKPGSVAQTEIAFKVIFVAVCVYLTIALGLYFVEVGLISAAENTYPSEPSTALQTVAWMRTLWHYLYAIALTVILFNLRGYIRKRYAIPGNEVKDCCCSFWCPCLVVTQMMRHTTDYDMYPSMCCTETGIPPHAPEIV